jgi:hypothetical protein
MPPAIRASLWAAYRLASELPSVLNEGKEGKVARPLDGDRQ